MDPTRRNPIEPGSRIAEYVVRKHIARGGFGTIWAVEHVRTGELAALKVLHPELASSTELTLRFEREAEAASLLRHDNIVEIYQRGHLDDGRPYFIMEYIPGIDLEAYLRSRGSLSPRQILTIVDQLGDALSAAHARGIVHRDLKASNVLLAERAGKLRVVLLDFGIAKLLEDSGARLTGSRAMIGTPSCMAPEQIRCKPVDARTDVYLLGALVYHMLTGELPFWNESLIATLYLHLHAPPPQPSRIGEVPAAFDDVVTRAMRKRPSERFDDVAGFVAAFRSAMRNTPLHHAGDHRPARPAQALGLYLHVHADPSCPDDLDDELLDDMESILPLVERYLGKHGYVLAHDNGNSALYILPMPVETLPGATRRRQAVHVAAALRDVIASRPHRDHRVRVSLYLHVADAYMDGDSVRGGALLDLDEWVPGASDEGIFGSSAILHRLDLPRDLVVGTPVRFYRIAADPSLTT